MQTCTTLELVKKDLSEFGDVVATEASALASTTVESVRQQAQNIHQMMSFEEEGEEQQEEVKKTAEVAASEVSCQQA